MPHQDMYCVRNTTVLLAFLLRTGTRYCVWMACLTSLNASGFRSLSAKVWWITACICQESCLSSIFLPKAPPCAVPLGLDMFIYRRKYLVGNRKAGDEKTGAFDTASANAG